MQASSKRELTNWENIFITKNKAHIINFEILPADHLNPVEGNRTAPKTNLNSQQSAMGVDNEKNVFESALSPKFK